jgi:hypothetical protein
MLGFIWCTYRYVYLDYLNWKQQLITALRDVYFISRGPLWNMSHGKQIQAYQKRVQEISTSVWQEVVSCVDLDSAVP